MLRRMTNLYRRKPVEVEAMGPLDAFNGDEIAAWCGGIYSRSLECVLIEPSHQRQIRLPFGHHLVLSPIGVEILTPEEFESLYEKVEADG